MPSWEDRCFEAANGSTFQEVWNSPAGYASLVFDALKSFNSYYGSSAGRRGYYSLGTNSRGDFGGGGYLGEAK
ncbi:MAG: hypothetical protein IPP17_04390 [Bacteroidetes bacterium]|nr:hypothetical protein [Bacteroidota bacterium]